MQKDEILEFLGKINSYLTQNWREKLTGEKFEPKIFGKSALLLAGLQDSTGTRDIDLLRIEGNAPSGFSPEIIAGLEREFGNARVAVNGYYLEFVNAAFVMLAPNLEWISLNPNHAHLSPAYLEPHHVIGGKLFSAFADFPRKRDKQDIRAALDQGLVKWARVCGIADQLFKRYQMDSRSDRFEEVFEYITGELFEDYGLVDMEYQP